jgi:hypothetical protein
LAGTLKEQLRPSALLAGLPAAAALVALMQNTRSAAAIISIVNLMTRVLPMISRHRVLRVSPNYITKAARADIG